MKSVFSLITCLLFTCFLGFSQNLEKIKGNRNVTIVETQIPSFNTIALDEDFNIEIIFNSTPSVEIETDENLHDFIKFEVIDSVLTFNKTARITSKKRLNIKVKYDRFLERIEATDNSEILSLTTMDPKVFSLKASGASKVGLTIKSDHFSLEGNDKSRIKLNLTSKNCTTTLSGSSKLEALINASQFSATIFQRATMTIEGSSDTSTLDLDNNARFDGRNFTINTCNVICEINSDAYLEVLENITIEASGTSTVYLYENPKITINKFTDTSRLLKKVK
ncbi:DUF2807 domain-containing protein [Tamlana sp. 2201CG12-4]|uniref:GIN domain-containing protein n=1 Tax=Tamlana sp. 2201CG12-4 TaxID=3112582 RepID=UPI002DB9DDBE|nr:DUF2807 domain-containing protein [Tamlana sp. 2201CG12-4]MEC3908268.1 DUF2807 domain-containing protein [Tamlana sp. 2201CG12-4]